MIRNVTGDLLRQDADALVNTVNTAGIMGKGIALQFKRAWPEMFRDYEAACERGEVSMVGTSSGLWRSISTTWPRSTPLVASASGWSRPERSRSTTAAGHPCSLPSSSPMSSSRSSSIRHQLPTSQVSTSSWRCAKQ